MELKAGYKQTEYGQIPKEWEFLPLGDLIKEMTDYVAAGSFESLRNNVIVYDRYNFALYVRLYDLRLGLGHSRQKYVDKASYKFLSKSNLFGNEILMANIGANVGETVLMPELNQSATIAPNMILIRTNDKYLQFSYLYYYSKSMIGVQRLFELIAGSGHPKINKTDLKKWLVLVPTEAEQTAVANALSDADALIQSLTRLIAKKRQIKQGAMQTLLNPYENGRLKAGWVVKKLGDVGVFSKGAGVRKDEAQSGSLPCIRYGEIYTRHSDYIKQFYSFISKDVAKIAKRIKSGDLLFAGSGETKAEIGKCVAFVHDYEVYAGGDIVILGVSAGDTLFYGYYLNTNSIIKQKASKGQGDAVVHISATALGDIDIVVPEEKSEQTRIATILSNMDTNITALETKLTKTQQIKQGMMQNLLTGRIRLI